MRTALALTAVLLSPAAAQDEVAAAGAADPSLADLQAFVAWLDDYRQGAIRLMRDLQLDTEALRAAEERIAALAAWQNLAAAKHLFEAASVDPAPPGERTSTDRIDFQAELQPWKIRKLARDAIAAMQCEGLDEWLLGMVEGGTRVTDDPDARRRIDAALQILGARETVEGQLALLKASRAMPPGLRLRAVDVLASSAAIDTVPHLLDLLRDKEPDMRIAALNAVAAALAPHTDETEHDGIPDDVAKLRDTAIERIEPVLCRDRVWQVRNAALHALVALRTRHAVPALIAGYESELGRKKDPWAMDVRFHKALRGLTGQSIPLGDARPWKAFWRAEGAALRLRKPGQPGSGQAAGGDDRYGKFFSIDIDSDRVLFVVDFSGSMEEPITLQTETTSSKPGTTTTKARLVVEELRKIVLSLPDGSWFNIVVFSDDVRIWRPAREGVPELVRLDDETRDDLLGNFLNALQPRGPTNLHGALDAAVGFAGRGLHDKHYALGFDTVYVLSDGAPSYGAVTDKDEIRRLVREANRLKRLTIHCVTFGEKNDTDFLRLLAEENGGRHIHVE